MPNTLVHDASPPTEKDPALTAGAAPGQPGFAPPPKKKSRAGLWIGLSVGIVSLLIGAGAAFYLLVWQYEATARDHVPDNAVFAARLEASDLLLFKPFREHIWSVLEKRAKKSKNTRTELIKKETGVDIEKDVREVVVASVDGTDWVLLLGGQIKRGDVVEGMHKVLEAEGVGEWKVKDGVLLGPAGLSIAQADDGTVILGTNEDVVRSSLGKSTQADKLDLPKDGALAFGISDKAVSSARKAAGPLASHDGLKQLKKLNGKMVLGDDPELSVELSPIKGVDAEELAKNTEDLIADARLLLFLVPDVAGEKDALRNAEVKAEAKKVQVTAKWPYEPLDKAAKDLGKALETVLPDE